MIDYPAAKAAQENAHRGGAWEAIAAALAVGFLLIPFIAIGTAAGVTLAFAIDRALHAEEYQTDP